jgi:hypothetical protein
VLKVGYLKQFEAVLKQFEAVLYEPSAKLAIGNK